MSPKSKISNRQTHITTIGIWVTSAVKIAYNGIGLGEVAEPNVVRRFLLWHLGEKQLLWYLGEKQ